MAFSASTTALPREENGGNGYTVPARSNDYVMPTPITLPGSSMQVVVQDATTLRIVSMGDGMQTDPLLVGHAYTSLGTVTVGERALRVLSTAGFGSAGVHVTKTSGMEEKVDASDGSFTVVTTASIGAGRHACTIAARNVTVAGASVGPETAEYPTSARITVSQPFRRADGSQHANRSLRPPGRRRLGSRAVRSCASCRPRTGWPPPATSTAFRSRSPRPPPAT